MPNALQRRPVLALFALGLAAASTGLIAGGDERGMLLPLQDRVGDREIAAVVERVLRDGLQAARPLADHALLRDALRRLRIRDVTATNLGETETLAQSLGVQWFFAATLHQAEAAPEPQVTISAWAYRVGELELSWAGFRSSSGLDSRRVLGRGRVEDLAVLAERAAHDVVVDYLRPDARGRPRGVRPARHGFRLQPLTADTIGRVAVVPFAAVCDRSPTLAAETVEALARAELFRHGIPVAHPGLVRSLLLARGDVPGALDPYGRGALRLATEARHFVTGTVERWGLLTGGEEPEPEVAFSLRLVEVDTGRVMWMNDQHRTGRDHQGLFGRGRIFAAGTLAEEMMQALLADLMSPRSARARER